MRLLADTFGWQLRGESARFDGICTDTRQLLPGQLFVALRGENFDGHAYVAQATRDGAVGALVSEPVVNVEPLLIAGDTELALGKLAALHRASFKGHVYAVTGSAGKTTTKDMLAEILSLEGPVLATRGNFNNEIGVPLTLFQLRAEHRNAVIEMGAARPGDIRYLVDIAGPTTSIITNAMPAHLAGFGSLAQVAQTKGEIFVTGPGCVAVINIDDPHAELWCELAQGARIVSYSATGKAGADVRASHVECGSAGVDFVLQSRFGDCDIHLQVPGRHNVANALAAAGAALSRDVDLQSVQSGLNRFSGVPGRLQMLRSSSGRLVIDDSYNANPQAVRSALDVLCRQTGKKVFLFGGMAELGESSAAHHRDVGSYARQCGIDLLLAVGAEAAETARVFGPGAQTFEDREQLAEWLAQGDDLSGYDAWLVKGSRSAGMDKLLPLLLESGGER